MKLLAIIFFFISFDLRAKDPLMNELGNLTIQENFSAFVMKCDERVELLDYYEVFDVESEYKNTLEHGDVDHIITQIISRMKMIAPEKAAHLLYWKKYFFKMVKFVKGMNFGPLKDEFDFIHNNDCEIKTLFKAIHPGLKKGKKIFIDQDLWDQLDNKSKAGAVVNYLINLEYVFMDDHEFTVYSRFLNGFLASDKVITLTNVYERSQFWKALDYDNFYYKGVFWSFKTERKKDYFQFDQNQDLYSGVIAIPLARYTRLGFTHQMVMSNVKDLVISFPWKLDLFVGGGLTQTFKDVELRSNCIGPYSLPLNTKLDEVEFKFESGKFVVNKILLSNASYLGKKVKELHFQGGEIKVITELKRMNVLDLVEMKACTL